MATYTELLGSNDSVFSSSEWKGLVVPAFPANFFPHDTPDEFVVYEIIPSGSPTQEFADAGYLAGLIVIQVYTQANMGPKRMYELADNLADLFRKKQLMSTQTQDGELTIIGLDKDDTSLFRADYSLKFNSF